jgi:hypothetical protein
MTEQMNISKYETKLNLTKPLHVIKWQGKEYRIPFDLDLTLDDKDKLIDVPNRFSGEIASLPWFAVAVYDLIMGAEQFNDSNTMQAGLSWFRKYFPNEYMTILD